MLPYPWLTCDEHAVQAQVRTLDLLNTVQALSAPGSCYAERVGAAFRALPVSTRSRSGADPPASEQQVPAEQSKATRSNAAQRSSNAAAADSSAQAVKHPAHATAATASGADPPVYVGDAYYAAKDLLIRV